MKFNEATSILFDSLDWSDLASAMGGTMHETHILTFNALVGASKNLPTDGNTPSHASLSSASGYWKNW